MIFIDFKISYRIQIAKSNGSTKDCGVKVLSKQNIKMTDSCFYFIYLY